RKLLLALALLATCTVFAAPPPLPDAARQLTRDIYKELVEINTTDSIGNTTTAAEAMAARLRAAGFPAADVQVLGPNPRKGNLVARLHGSGAKKPLLLLAHLDVVEAKREDWSVDPFTFLEKDGYFYGRGTGDDKAMAAIWIATLIRFKQEGFVPKRDLIVALTADEETGDANGVQWLLQNHRELIDAEFALNEGGGGAMRKGKYLYNGVGASEKVYVTFRLETKNKGGHSSVPQKANAIYELAEGLTRIARYDFPVKLNEVTRAYFSRMASIEDGPKAADMRALAERDDPQAAARLAETPPYNARMRTTCVATRLEGGHADNALPQSAKATVNCRVLPGEDPEAVRSKLVEVLADPSIEVTWIDRAKPSIPSPLTPAVMKPIADVTEEFWPGVPVMPLMATGASDGLYTRNAGIPTYGISGIFSDIEDSRAHGRDERVGVPQFYEGTQFLYTLVRRLAA
ncbi:MAG TPA: M20/M25/M40 family metallo-hydrolase, partial [Thermoanaerobaculia bacterium]|nr:M20/M25/M40 family metallo-hydrolase [Thermoanaerobaculia bacterium]